MDVRKYINENIALFDGGMGTMLQSSGLKLGEKPEVLNITECGKIIDIHKKYIEAGAKFITTNTFGANRKKLTDPKYSVGGVVKAAMINAKEARGDKEVFIALDLGPIGELLEPMGTVSFEEAVEIFKEQIQVGAENGADLILIETMTDLFEVKAAIIAAKETCDLPIFVTMSFERDYRTFQGCTPEAFAVTVEALGVDALGVNCSLGPVELYDAIKVLTENTNLPIIMQANAGLPQIINKETKFVISKEEFSEAVLKCIDIGVSIVGGCCGTDETFIRDLSEKIKDKKIAKREDVKISKITSGRGCADIGTVRIVGERINPTGKKLFKEALINNNLDYILKQGIEQVEAGADILDVNVGLPGISEKDVMVKVIKELQAILDVPLQIDSSKQEVIEAALRNYNGKPIVNSVNGDDEVLDSILPIVKKYGAAVLGLTLDKRGIPETAQERFLIAKKIVAKCEEYGIKREDIIIDTLTLTASAEQDKVVETLKAIELVKSELGVKTSLGVSNISFGLPNRDLINETFLAQALYAGLDLPIINPNNSGMIRVIDTHRVLHNIDKSSQIFIEKYKNTTTVPVEKTNKEDTIVDFIVKGLKNDTILKTKELLETYDEYTVIDKYLIKGLDKVSEKFDMGEIFLPQLISSAEACKGGFEIIKERLLRNNKAQASKGKIVLATVKGDIHDIGKNIVKVLLENYGFEVIDLGKDVGKNEVLTAALKEDVMLVGLSALMTTTIDSMEEIIAFLQDNEYGGKIMVGGAVLTESYSKKIKADYYAKDAKEAVRIAREVYI